MRQLQILLFSLFGILCLASCKEHRPDPLESQARDLFDKSSAMIRAYTDSMNAANDSALWARLDRDFDRRLARLNFEYPADTDLRMTEGENDTLYYLTNRYVVARDAAIDRILHPQEAPADSI